MKTGEDELDGAEAGSGHIQRRLWIVGQDDDGRGDRAAVHGVHVHRVVGQSFWSGCLNIF